MMREKILNDLKEAMKNKDKEKLAVIRMIKGAMQMEELNLKRECTDDEMIGIISKQIKTRKESMVEFEKAGRTDLMEQTQKEIDFLNTYMPEQLSEEEILKESSVVEKTEVTSENNEDTSVSNIEQREEVNKNNQDTSNANIKIEDQALNNTPNQNEKEEENKTSSDKTNTTILEETPKEENVSQTEEQVETPVVKSADEAVLEYVNTIQEDANNGITDTLKNGFITVVDFLFYNGEIAGHTFSELTTSAKLEVLKAALWIDDKVDSVFPGYKETISNGASKVYNGIKNLIVSTYLDITSNICENHSDLCESAKNDFQSMKESFGFTWDFIKDLASSGISKLKGWYEVWSGK